MPNPARLLTRYSRAREPSDDQRVEQMTTALLDVERDTTARHSHPVAVPVRAPPVESQQNASSSVRVGDAQVPLHAAGCVKGADLKKATGIRVYDPGYANTLSCTSSITYIDGANGVLSHRGYRLEALVANATYAEVSHLLIRGALPSVTQYKAWTKCLYENSSAPRAARYAVRALPRTAHPMGALVTALAAAGANAQELNPAVKADVYSSASAREAAVLAVLRAMPHLAAGLMRHKRGCRTQFLRLPAAAAHWGFARRFLYLVDPALVSGRAASARVKAVDALLTAHADHEQNCSTSALRHLASSGVDIFSATAGATAALYGPLHGGACEAVVRMLRRVGGVENVASFLQRVKGGQERLMGFGHRVYKSYDPRARVIRVLAKEAAKHAGEAERKLLDVAQALENAALEDEYFVKRRLFPNVDFYSGFVYLSLGFQPEFFPVMFALGRAAGWMAHWLECLADPDLRIARPHQIYTGERAQRDVVPLAKRGEAPLLPWVREKRAKL